MTSARVASVDERAALIDQLVARHAHHTARDMAERFVAVDPDAGAAEADDAARERCVDALDGALTVAGYRALSDDEVKASVRAEGIFPLSYDVDHTRLAFTRIWVRGERDQETTRPVWLGLRREPVRFRAYESVLIALAFRRRVPSLLERIRARVLPPTVRHDVAPGRLSLRLVRDVPKADLEIVFPDPTPRMKNTQVLTIAVPFVSGVGILVWEWIVRPTLEGAGQAAFSDAALTAVAIALAGHAYKTWQSHRAAVRAFVDEVTRSLYFRSVAVNVGVPAVVAREAANALAACARAAERALEAGPRTQSALVEELSASQAQAGVDGVDGGRALSALTTLGVVEIDEARQVVRAPSERLRAALLA